MWQPKEPTVPRWMIQLAWMILVAAALAFVVWVPWQISAFFLGAGAILFAIIVLIAAYMKG